MVACFSDVRRDPMSVPAVIADRPVPISGEPVPAPGVFPEGHLVPGPGGGGGVRVQGRGERDAEPAGQLPEDGRDAAGPRTGRRRGPAAAARSDAHTAEAPGQQQATQSARDT